VIGIVAVVYTFVQLYTSMPSKAEVMDFATGAMDSLPEAADVITGSLIPDAATPSDTSSEIPTTLPTTEASAPADWLTPGQRETLAALGIDEADLPATLTPALEACLVDKLGADRVAEVKAGDTPTVIEGVRAATCL
jgi:hypothetical protein